MQYPEDTGPLDHLELRSVGLLTVGVVQAFDLPAADMGGTSDPFVEVFTDTSFKYKTKVVKANLNPTWSDEKEYFFVQEPRTQSLKINVYDVDIINARNLMKSFNVLKSIKEMVGAEELLGRTQVSIQPLMENPGMEVDEVYDLGMGEWSSVGGTGSGCGQVRLKLVYRPFSMLNPAASSHGALILRVRCTLHKLLGSFVANNAYDRTRDESTGYVTTHLFLLMIVLSYNFITWDSSVGTC